MCMAVAIGYDWLYSVLSSSTKEIVRNAILKKAFDAAIGHWFYSSTSNWNQVCNAGLTYGAIAIYDEEPVEAKKILDKALETNVIALHEYGPDGNYQEGPMYWEYGSSFQVMMLAALETAFGSDADLHLTQGFLESTEYMMYVSGPTGYRFNYADCSNLQVPKPAISWMANKLDNPSILYREKQLMDLGLYTRTYLEDRILPIAVIHGKDVDFKSLNAPNEKIWKGAGATPVVLVRTGWEGSNDKFLGIKGGSASVSHSHMDAGTFVYDAARYRWAMDFGLQSYGAVEPNVSDFWNLGQTSGRWDVFRLRNRSHNTLTINNQRHNVKGDARFINYFESPEKLGGTLDLTNTLNFGEELVKATRTAAIINESYLEIVDSITTGRNSTYLYWNMATPAEVEVVNSRTLRLTQGLERMLLEFSSPTAITLEPTRSVNPGNTYESGNGNNKMLGFIAEIPRNTSTTFTVTMKQEEAVKPNGEPNKIYLKLPLPAYKANEGNRLYFDDSSIGIDQNGTIFNAGFTEDYGWTIYGETENEQAFGTDFLFRKTSMRTVNLEEGPNFGAIETVAGIDRSADGQLGVRGGTNGIDSQEGFILGFNLTNVSPELALKIVGVELSFVRFPVTGMIVNRNDTNKRVSFGAVGTNADKELDGTGRGIVDVSSLDILLNGGQIDNDLASVFNTTTSDDNIRIAGFVLEVSSRSDLGISNEDQSREPIVILEEVLRTHDTNGSHWAVYPNPVADYLTLRFDNTQLAEISICTQAGQEIKEGYQISLLDGGVSLDMTGLPKGIYLVKVSNSSDSWTSKILKR